MSVEAELADLRGSWRATFRKLAWRYGKPRALDIVNGEDDEALADLASWLQLGRKVERRAWRGKT